MKAYFIFSVLFICCATPKQEDAIHSIETLQKEMINHQIEELRKINFLFRGTVLTVKDTTLESEGESWKGLNYYYEDDLFLVAETSWNNPELITRISVKSPLLKTKDGLGVGGNFESIKDYITFNSWTDFPDGYVAFKDSSDNRIIYVMNTETQPRLGEGALTIDKIPATLQVHDVIIMQ